MAHSNDYLKQLQQLHSKKSFGNSEKLPKVVTDLIEDNNIKSILDFGAGKGKTSAFISKIYPDVTLYSYDPVTFPIQLPESVELIYSSDVLEHIEPELLDDTLKDLFSRASKYQYHLIACHPAKKKLNDGRNAHLIIESPEWWSKKINEFKEWKIVYEQVTESIAKLKKGSPINVIKYIIIMERI